MPTLPVDQLREVATTVFRRVHVPEEDARLIAGLLVKANLAGHDSHGVVRIPSYIEGVKQGQIRPGAELQVLDETPTSVRLKGGNNFGQVVLTRGIERALEKSAQAPISMVTVMQYSHCGQLGSYAQMLAAQNRIGMVLLGKQRGVVVPWGGRQGRLYQNTMSLAIPSRKPFPLVLDMATSVAPFGKILVQQARDEPCPEGWIVDAEGNPSTDPHLDFSRGEGGMLPLGGPLAGHKGSGLSFVLGLLVTALSGAGSELEGTLIIAINPATYTPMNHFMDEVDHYIDYLHATPPAAGFDQVLAPGERSYRESQRRRQEGIYVEPGTWEQIQALAVPDS